VKPHLQHNDLKAGREHVLGEAEIMQKQTVKQAIPEPVSSGK